MARKADVLEKEQAYRETFLARLSQRLAAPTLDWPTVRCWTGPALDRVFKQVRDELAMERLASDISHRSLLEWVCRLRLASPLPVEGESIYLVEIGASAEAEVDPLELLMASKPSGVVCYFSAVGFHALTTQPRSTTTSLNCNLRAPARRTKARKRTAPSGRRGRRRPEVASPVGLGSSSFVSRGSRFTAPAARAGWSRGSRRGATGRARRSASPPWSRPCWTRSTSPSSAAAPKWCSRLGKKAWPRGGWTRNGWSSICGP